MPKKSEPRKVHVPQPDPPQGASGTGIPADQQIVREEAPPDRPNGKADGPVVFNDPPDIVNIRSSQQFIKEIHAEISKGYGFVPFIGAGMSAPSGAPLVSELHHYLHACIAMALGVEKSSMRPWSPRTDQWPPFTMRSRFSQDDWFVQIRDEYDRRARQAWSPELRIFQEAMGALAEWRGALVFLSRVVRETRIIRGEKFYGLALDAPDAEVIDSGIRRAMSGRQPTLGHRMLATLATLLRLDIVLTTNFDDLLETAFKDARNPLSVFEVHLASNLPPWSALEEKRSLVKMHGNLYSLRVDYTLDALPVEADRWRFLEYLLSPKERTKLAGTLRKDYPAPGSFEHGSHLLVMGVAASERRTRAFIEHACQHLGDAFRVFWLCFTMDDLRAVERFARDAPAKGNKFRILRHPNYGLLFTEMYQTIRRGIPTSGIIYPAASRLAMPPMPRVDTLGKSSTDDVKRKESDKKSDEYGKAVKERLDQIQGERYEYHKLIVATSTVDNPSGVEPVGDARACTDRPRNPSGITSACAKVFEEIRVKQIAIWLDMNDVSSTDDLFEQLLDAASYRLGLNNPMPVYVRKLPEAQADEIIGLANDTNTKWVFFLNARETPGTNLIDERDQQRQEEELPNNWLDEALPEQVKNEVRADDESSFPDHFLRFITRLCGPNSPLISVVLMCRQRSDGTNSGLVQHILGERLGSSLIVLGIDCAGAKEVDAVVRVLEWANTPSDPQIDDRAQRRRFLQALISLQRTRYLATIWSAACGGTGLATTPGDEEQASTKPEIPDMAIRWVEDLETRGLVRRKPGGFIWIHSRTRTALRCALFNPQRFFIEYEQDLVVAGREKLERHLDGWNPSAESPQIHWELSQWYRRILAASRSPAAVFEAVYHACRSAEDLIRSAGPDAAAMIQVAIRRLDWASSLLHTHSFLVQTQGYSRGSCRRLDNIRKNCSNKIDDAVRSVKHAGDPDRDIALEPLQTAVTASTRRLRIRCTEVMRSIAREVGEDRLAYNRQRELRALLSGDGLEVKELGKGEASERMLLSILKSPDVCEETSFDRGESLLEWIRWWRWNGMLGIASRSYVAARRSLLRAALSVILDQPDDYWDHVEQDLDRISPRAKDRKSQPPEPSDEIEGIIGKLAKSCEGVSKILGHPIAGQQRLRVEIARIVEQIITLEMQEVGLLGKCKALLKEYESVDLDRRYRRIVDWIKVAKGIVESVRSNDHSPDSHDTVLALWCHSRLLMHEGLSQGRLDSPNEAMTLLSDSESALNLYDPRRLNVDLAIIELHRAEVRLTQANKIKIPWFDGQPPITPFRDLEARVMNETFGSATWKARGGKLRESLLESESKRPNPLRSARSLVQDGLSFLERADRILSMRRRNVGWSTWFFHRKLAAISMSVWATVLEEGTPIPFLGIEAAPRGCPTIADRTLKDAQRMIRIDAYRLATIVEAYAQCVKGFFARIYLERPSDTLAERQADMIVRLGSATRRLEEILDERKNNDRKTRASDNDGSQQDNDLDPRAVEYVEETIKHSKSLIKKLSIPLI